MTSLVSDIGSTDVTAVEQTEGSNANSKAKRYRLPGIVREGIAQLSLLETALWPLRGGSREKSTFDTTYHFKVGDDKREAFVSVSAPLGLQSIDEYILWGLLGTSLSH